MKPHRFWIEIVAVATLAACALALLIGTLGVVAGAATGALQSQTTKSGDERTYEGVVTCSRCGARLSAAMGQTAADCARICVHQGAKFALAAGDKTYLLDADPYTLKRLAGQRIGVMGVTTGNTVRVSSLSATQ